MCRDLAAAQSLLAAVNIVAMSRITLLHPCPMLVSWKTCMMQNLVKALLMPGGLYRPRHPMSSYQYRCPLQILLLVCLVPYQKESYQQSCIFCQYNDICTQGFVIVDTVSTGDVGFLFVHQTDIAVPLNLQVKVGLNSPSDVFIHIVPYGPAVGAFVFSLSVMEPANLAKQILTK